ncbi:MAG: flavodoxin family protein [Clostridiales bacterium]|nr:flavodoxin family protein [Clostridiales bacterium]
MKILLVNGSPNEKGCTYTALSEIAKELHTLGVESEVFYIGKNPVRGCIACLGCRKNGGKCVFNDDAANALAQKMKEADGIIIGSPVYYAGPNGALTALLDRAFYSAQADWSYKPAAAIVSCRRGGASAAFDRLNKYFTINRMPIVSSQYWNSVHGMTPEEVVRDEEGMQTMRLLARNMAWLLKGLGDRPEEESQKKRTNFIK